MQVAMTSDVAPDLCAEVLSTVHDGTAEHVSTDDAHKSRGAV